MSDKYLAIDIGGTNLKYGLLDRSGQLLEHDKEATPSSNLDDFWQAVRAIIAKYKGRSAAWPSQRQARSTSRPARSTLAGPCHFWMG